MANDSRSIVARSPRGGLVRVIALFGGVTRFGAERSNIEMLLALKAQGAAVLLLVPDAPWADDIRRYLELRGFEIHLCPYLLIPRRNNWLYPLWSAPWVMLRALSRFRQVDKDFQATHIHVAGESYALTFLLAMVSSRKPVIYRCDSNPTQHNIVWRLIWRFIVWRSDMFVAVSRSVENRVKATGVAAPRITVIYNLPPTRVTGGDPEIEIDASGRFTIIFAGQIVPAKGPHLLIEAFEQIALEFPEAHLVIAGRISDWSGDEWARNLRSSTLSASAFASRIRFTGFIENIPELMGKCDVCVVPTITEEPLGNVVMEAKLAGIPSIIFPSGGLPEMITDRVDGYICAEKSALAIAEALRFYLTDPHQVRRQGQAARLSLSRLTGDFAGQCVSVYRNTVARRSSLAYWSEAWRIASR